MKSIKNICLETAETYGQNGNYITNANITGFTKLIRAMWAYSVVQLISFPFLIAYLNTEMRPFLQDAQCFGL